MNSESDLKQATRGGEAALAELMADAAALDREGAALAREAAALDQRQKKELAVLGPRKAQYAAINRQYLDALAKYKEKQVAFEADSRELSSQSAAVNSVPPEQREAAVNRLKQWSADSAARKASLDAEGNALLQQHAAVEAERLAVREMEGKAGATLSAERDAILAKIDARKTKRESLYGQLRQCAIYVAKIRDTRRARFGHTVEASPVLDGAQQRLKLYEAGATK
ncbi:MAG: hypothetical protein WC213_13325 [Arenimonas sp.]